VCLERLTNVTEGYHAGRGIRRNVDFLIFECFLELPHREDSHSHEFRRFRREVFRHHARNNIIDRRSADFFAYCRT